MQQLAGDSTPAWFGYRAVSTGFRQRVVLPEQTRRLLLIVAASRGDPDTAGRRGAPDWP
jgi:hypothetical protein